MFILLLVEGIKEQTVEAIQHLKQGRSDDHLPVIVVLTHWDLPEHQRIPLFQIQQQLMHPHGIVCEDVGGDVQCVPVSSTTGLGIGDLQEAILAQSELLAPHPPLP